MLNSLFKYLKHISFYHGNLNLWLIEKRNFPNFPNAKGPGPCPEVLKIKHWVIHFLTNFLWKHINFMFFKELWEKNNPSWVNPSGIRKSHPRTEYFGQGRCLPSPWPKHSSLGWDFLVPHEISWRILLILHCCLTLQNAITNCLLWEKNQSYIIKIQLWRKLNHQELIHVGKENFTLWNEYSKDLVSLISDQNIHPSGETS